MKDSGADLYHCVVGRSEVNAIESVTVTQIMTRISARFYCHFSASTNSKLA